jgi:hypothetical protein
MAHYHATVGSRRGAAETFGYLARFSNAAEWDPGVLAGEQLDPGPVRLGTRFRLLVPFVGRRLPLTYVVTRYEPHREIGLETVSTLLRATDRITVTENGDGATVSYDAGVRLRGPLRLLDPLLRRGFSAVGDRAAAGLAEALSAQSPGRRQ